jgi:phenylacetate-coenzyme A ligase PaaK-like adenylate-forming protein
MADATASAAGFDARFDWPAERVAAYRRAALRRVVGTAATRSPWHAERLARVEPGAVDEEHLADLPVMTKDDLMDHFDEIVTDRRLTLQLVEAHLERLVDDAYLLGRYHAVASGGSTGRRGVFVYDWDGWTAFYLATVRPLLRAWASTPDGDGDGNAPVMATIAAERASHMTGAVFQTFSGARLPVHRFPITRPIPEIVSGLNQTQPTILGGYASALWSLSHEARAGRLRIRPRLVVSGSEPLLPEVRAGLEETWGVPVLNRWGASEGGVLAASCDRGAGMHLSDDLVIIEPVDEAGRPVPPGTGSAKVLLTNLADTTLPLIRYELTDEVTVLDEPCPCGSSFRRIDDIHGRLDETFRYGAIDVHPHLFRSPLGSRPTVLEYQVRQTSRGAVLALHCGGPVDLDQLRLEITASLTGLGLRDPEVVVMTVETLDRQATGKLRRFVPLALSTTIPEVTT